MIDFSVTADQVDQEVQESAPTMNLREPAIGPIQVQNIEKDELGDFDVLKFVYEFVDGEHEGEVFEQVEWKPREQDLQSKDEDSPSNFELELRRISRILSRVCGNKVADQATVFKGQTIDEAWEKMRELVVSAWDNEGDPEKVLQLKVQGNVYNGNANLTVGRYPNYVADPAIDNELRFSSWEQERNEEYMDFQSETPTDMDEVEDEEFDMFGG